MYAIAPDFYVIEINTFNGILNMVFHMFICVFNADKYWATEWMSM